MIDFVVMWFSKIWAMFSIPWPGFNFSIGSVFLAVLLSSGALTAIMKMTGVSITGTIRGFGSRGGNNRNIKVSDNRKGDTK